MEVAGRVSNGEKLLLRLGRPRRQFGLQKLHTRSEYEQGEKHAKTDLALTC